MTLPTISLPNPVTVSVLPLAPEAFAPFGTCITSPLHKDLNSVPASIPTPLHPSHQPTPIYANQNTALKTSPISPLINNYLAPPEQPLSKPLMSMFSCFPRPSSSIKAGKLQISILERHPFTTQTFSPLGLPHDSEDTVFLVVVAPSLSGRHSGVRNAPDLANIKAFVARGDQAVTYGAGTWHAPMIVLGEKRIDFVVTQFVNGVPEDDCQEVLFENVSVDVTKLELKRTKWKPRL